MRAGRSDIGGRDVLLCNGTIFYHVVANGVQGID